MYTVVIHIDGGNDTITLHGPTLEIKERLIVSVGTEERQLNVTDTMQVFWIPETIAFDTSD